MKSTMLSEDVSVKNRSLVSEYITAIGKKQYDRLASLLHKNFKFEGPITLNTADDFIRMLKDHENNSVTNIVIKK